MQHCCTKRLHLIALVGEQHTLVFVFSPARERTVLVSADALISRSLPAAPLEARTLGRDVVRIIVKLVQGRNALLPTKPLTNPVGVCSLQALAELFG